ncbi:MAG TPA: helix-turn-helix domain-containing protein [Polyangia bacterium]|jgi:cytoskeletal protein RodZ
MNQDIEHFGISLRRARQDRALTLGEIAASTKVPRTALELIEEGSLDGLPADVFVRGFIRSYARAVGMSELQPLAQFDRALRARTEAARAESALPVVDPMIAGIATGQGQTQMQLQSDDDSEAAASSRRGLGLAVFVIVLLLIATITLSLLLRRPPPSGEGLSLRLRGAEGASPLPRALPETTS